MLRICRSLVKPRVDKPVSIRKPCSNEWMLPLTTELLVITQPREGDAENSALRELGQALPTKESPHIMSIYICGSLLVPPPSSLSFSLLIPITLLSARPRMFLP